LPDTHFEIRNNNFCFIDLNFLFCQHLTRVGVYSKNSHYEASCHWENLLYRNGKNIAQNPTFVITREWEKYAEKYLPVCKKYFPEVLEKNRRLADEHKDSIKISALFC